MTDNKIIYKAVLKAETNGYKSIDTQYFLDNNLWAMIIFDIEFAKAFFGEKEYKTVFSCGVDHRCVHEELANKRGYENGGCSYCKKCNSFERDTHEEVVNEGYKYHLCQMVILPDNKRIKYLEKFL